MPPHPHPLPHRPLSRQHLSLLLSLFLLIISYILGIYSTTSHPSLTASPSSPCHVTPPSPPLNFLPSHSALDILPPINETAPPIQFCAPNFTDYSPCHDPNREHLFSTLHYTHRERHCPPPEEKPKPRCRVPAPEGYRRSVGWPESRERVWFGNVPSKMLIEAKKDQRWVVLQGEWLVFPGGGTGFPHGVREYIEGMGRLVPLKGGEVRTVLDIGCGVASFGGHLLDYDILTMSVAPRDVHEAQVQFALERGLPAMLGVLSSTRLPYPSRSFDMAHCARCLIHWEANDGKYLLEIDRVLRPGGYWVLSGPPINWKVMYKGWKWTADDLRVLQNSIEDLAKKLCWQKVVEKGVYAVWRKPSNHVHCIKKSKTLKSPPFCERVDPDAGWYTKLESCITPLPKVEAIVKTAGGTLSKWPRRLNAVPPRIYSGSIKGITADTFNHDNQIWNKRVSNYNAYINLAQEGRFRNVMDMNAGIGGFAAAMSKYPVWVMNVVPVNLVNNTLGIIFERGLLGTYMDWCEAFSTYARTYDLVHANGIFSMYMDKCDIIDILLEMDRILRPEGEVIIRDHVDVVVKVKREADRLHWHSRIVHSEMGPYHPDKLLIVDNSLGEQ